MGAQPDTCSTSPALPPAPTQPPSWASVVRDGMGNSSSSLQTQTAADFSNHYIRCMASGFRSCMAFSCAVGCQEATIFCHFLTSSTTTIKPAYRLLHCRCCRCGPPAAVLISVMCPIHSARAFSSLSLYSPTSTIHFASEPTTSTLSTFCESTTGQAYQEAAL